MKKLGRVLCVILSMLLIVTAFTGCNNSGANKIMDNTYSKEDNLAADATYFDQEGKESKKFKLKGKGEETTYITVDLGEIKSFNTVVLKESTNSVTLFEIYGTNDLEKDYKFLYQSDCIEAGHTCYLGDVQYRYLRIIVNQSSDDYKLTDCAVYNIKNDNAKDLRVTAYFVATDIKEDTDFSKLDGVTDVILFGTIQLDEKGSIKTIDQDGNEADESLYAHKVKLLRKAIGNRDIKVHCDIGLPYGDDNAHIINMLNEDNVDNTIANIKAFIEKYDFDGYGMDYEFPYKSIEWKQLNEFLRKLDKAMPDRLISLAIAPWDLRFDDDVIQIIDRAEVMLYDMFTAHGYHSIFSTTVNGVQKMLNGGFSPQQIDLGVPFYSRPTNRLGYWGSYEQFEDKLDRYTNLIYYNDYDYSGAPMTAPQYINSVQMIADKTAFAIDAGLGGIMVWHLNCDLEYSNELSLFRAINETKEQKQK